MAKLRCKDYGFEDDFEIQGDTEKVITDFGDHMLKVHGIEYSKEVIMQFIQRKS